MTTALMRSSDMSEAVARWSPLPQIDLRQLLALSDDTGLFQHAIFSLPDPNYGYCIDDNVRALIAGLMHAQLRGHDERVVPVQRYLTFVAYAFNEQTGRFRNFMGYDRRWLEDEGSQDSQGRAVWGLGVAVETGPTGAIRELSLDLLNRALPAVGSFEHLRSWAFAMLGLDSLLNVEPGHQLAGRLFDRGAALLWQTFNHHAAEDWPWWEDTVTYDNAKLPHALMIAGRRLGDRAMADTALRALDWLMRVQTAGDGHLSIIGNRGWLQRDGTRARFDQQPLEAHAMVHACLAAARLSGQSTWTDRAWMCHEWFTGRNDLGLPLYHPETGGCQDGLMPDGVNKNQGAESSLAYLLSVLELHAFRESLLGRLRPAAHRPLRCAMIGAGRMAGVCLDAYRHTDGLEPVAVWSRTAAKAQALAGEKDLAAFLSLDELLANPGIDLVHIAATPAAQAELALSALAAGRHIVCESPMATTRTEASRMIEAARQRDLVLAVNHCLRYSPLYEPLRRLIADRLLGALLRGMVTDCAGVAELPPGHWFWDAQQSGGIFLQRGMHVLDALGGWLGRGQVLSAWRLERPDTQLVDQAGCELRYGEQATVSMYHGLHPLPSMQRHDWTFIFERGRLELRGRVPWQLQLHALLGEEDIAQLTVLLPDAHLQTLQRFEGSARLVPGHHREYRIDREVRLEWTAGADANAEERAVQGRSIRALLEDLTRHIADRGHGMQTTADDALSSLDLALEADRLSRHG